MHVSVVHDSAEQRTCHFDQAQVHFACLMSMRNTCNKCAFAVFGRRSSAHMRAFAVFGGAQRCKCAPLWFLQGSVFARPWCLAGYASYMFVSFLLKGHTSENLKGAHMA
jgi:hypothetical protein